MLLVIKESGVLSRAMTVSYNFNGFSMFGFQNNLLQLSEKWYMGGVQSGWLTRDQKSVSGKTDSDSFVMRLEFDAG